MRRSFSQRTSGTQPRCRGKRPKQLGKAFAQAAADTAWSKKAEVLQKTLEMVLTHGGPKETVEQLRDTLVAHSLAGPPKPPPTPEKLRKITRAVINLVDDEDDAKIVSPDGVKVTTDGLQKGEALQKSSQNENCDNLDNNNYSLMENESDESDKEE